MHILRFLFLIILLINVNSNTAFSKCSLLTTNYCPGNKSYKPKVFCSNPDGSSYEGYVNCSGEYEGRGKYTFSNGEKYIGQFRASEMHGYGIAHFASGDRYEGNFHLDKRSGKGIIYYADGDKYDGLWLEGKKNGKGVYYYNDGDYSKLNYSMGIKISETYYFKNGAIAKFELDSKGKRVKKTYIKTHEQVKNEKVLKQKEKQKKLALIRKKEEQQKELQVKIDRCLVAIYNPNKNWSENNARYLCAKAVNAGSNIIKRNCIIQKGKNKSRSFIKSVNNACHDISLNPSTIDKIRYGETVSKALNFF